MSGAHVRARTGDLFLTKEVLCLLSYVGPRRRAARALAGGASVAGSADPRQPSVNLGNSRSQTEVQSTDAALFEWEVVGREGIEPPQSKDG